MAEMMSRHHMLGLAAAAVGGVAALRESAHAETMEDPGGSQAGTGSPRTEHERPYWEESYSGGPAHVKPLPPGRPGTDYTSVVVPTGYTLPWKIIHGVKVFHVIAEEVDHAFDIGLRAKCWAYNGHVNSTVIEDVEGERVRIYVTNRLPVATSVHWHGIYLPNGMDGVGGLTQPYIKAGETAKYEFSLRQHGTSMFHSHHDEMTQMGMGLIGLFVIHPRNPAPHYHVDRDFAILLSEWDIPVGTARPNTLEMTDFNVLTMNGKVFPSTGPLVCKTGDKIRIRLGNLGAMDHHPIHIHGYHFRVTATDGEDIPLSAQWSETTVLVGVGQTRTIEFIADAPGDWDFHCHMTHHVMNQMGHEFPNMVGVNAGDLDERVRPLLPGYVTMGHTGMDMGRMAEVMPMPPNSIPMKGAVGPFGDYILMGGMFTIIKVRDRLDGYEKDSGWYQHPRGTVALNASAADLARDGIDVHAATPRAVSNAPNGSAPHGGSRGRVVSTPTPGHIHRSEGRTSGRGLYTACRTCVLVVEGGLTTLSGLVIPRGDAERRRRYEAMRGARFGTAVVVGFILIMSMPTIGRSGMMGQGPMEQPGAMRESPPSAPSGMMGSGMMGMMEGGGMGGHMGMMHPGRMLQMLKTELTLSEGQEKQLRDILYQVTKTITKQRADVRVAELELQQLLDADPVEMDKVETKLKDIEGLRTVLQLNLIKAHEQTKAMLSPEQRQKLERLHEHLPGMRGMMGEGGMGRMEMMGPQMRRR